MALEGILPTRGPQSSMLDIKTEQPTESSLKNTIHSGHFMVSRVHDVNNDDEDEVSVPFNDDGKGFNFLSASKETSKTYNFTNGSQSIIDASLTKLFECMSLAYSGKITSPRWKQFRGMHLTQKQRIRLNNLIWREWHMQYIYKKIPIVCQFATPLSDHIHSKPEAVVLEGKYWKRRLDTVTAEYKKCRRYFKRITQQQGINFREMSGLTESELLERVKDVTFINHESSGQAVCPDMNLLQTSIMDMDFTNDLIATLNPPFAFPNPRELSQLGYADLIQPGLIQLQPNLEEFMDIDSMQELLGTKIQTPFITDSSLPSSEMVQAPMQSSNLGDTSDMCLVDFFDSTNVPTMSDTVSSTSNVGEQLGLGGLPLEDANTSSRLSSLQHSESQQPQGGDSITLQLAPESVAHYPVSSSTTILLESPTSTNQALGHGRLLVSPQAVTILPKPTGLYQNLFSHNTVSVASAADSHKQPTVNRTSSRGFTIANSDLLVQMLQQNRPPQQQAQQQQLQQEPALIGLGVHKKDMQANLAFQPTSPTIHLQQLTQLQQQQQQQQHQQQQQQQQQLFQQSISIQQPILAQTLAAPWPKAQPSQPQATVRSSQQGRRSTVNKQGASSVSPARPAEGGGSNKKRDGFFAVPAAKTAATPRKNRAIAPAPAAPSPQKSTTPPSPSSQASYLAELLRNGTYPGAVIDVKKEPAQSSSPTKMATNYQLIRPSPPLPSQQTHQLPVGAVMTIAGPNPPQAAPHTGSPLSSREDAAMSSKAHHGIVIASPVPNLDNSSSSGLEDSSVDFCHPVDAKLSNPPIDLRSSTGVVLANSPTASSPLEIKQSPSPTMDTSSLLDPLASPYSPAMPMSPSSGAMGDSLGFGDSLFSKDNRRAAHLSAEQKRRCNLKTGFDMLQHMVPTLSQNSKVSKATMLQKTAEFCKKLKSERIHMQKEATILKQEIESLNSAISSVQSQLPETGVPVTRQRKDQMREMFDEYVRSRTLENWKFWIFSVIMNTLYDSYCNTVSTASIEEMCRTSLTWLDQSCSLVSLRPNVLNALRKLSTSTSILTEPQKVKEQALNNVSKKSPSRGQGPSVLLK